MVRRVTGSSRSIRRSGSLDHIDGLTCDFWYTLAYLAPSARLRLERARGEVWADALHVAGVGATRGVRWANQLQHQAHADELSGRSPTVEQRARALSRRTPRPIDVDRLLLRLDRILLGADIRLAPGLVTALEGLRRSGIRLGIVSNVILETSRSMHAVLRQLNLSRYFSATVLSADVGRSKPDPAPFRRCLELLGTSPRATAHIGDQIADVQGARRAAMRPVLYTGLHRWSPPRVRVHQPDHIPGVPRITSWTKAVVLFGAKTT